MNQAAPLKFAPLGQAEQHASGAAPDGPSTLLGCLVVAARYRGVHLSVAQLVHDHLLHAGEPPLDVFLKIVHASGLRGSAAKMGWPGLMRMGRVVPAILRLRNGQAMVLIGVQPDDPIQTVVLQDPRANGESRLILDEARLSAAWNGDVVLIKRDHRLMDEEQPFGLRAILFRLLQYRNICRDILVAGFMLGLLSATPILFWRLLIDKVLYYQNLSTFTVLCIFMVVFTAFEAAFGYLRRFLVAQIVRRVDAALSTEIFGKMLNLPMDYFERTQTGFITRDLNEIYKIRAFLVTTVFGTMIDALVLVIFLPIMFFFSAILTFYVLGICALVCVWILAMLPTLHRKSGAVHRAEGIKGSYLVETVHGMRTIKSLSLDARRRHEWDVLVANAGNYRYEEQQTLNLVQTVILPLERLMTSGVMALGVYLAITTQQQVYVGALVAFMMLSQRVAGPLIQLSAGLQDLDEARLAVLAVSKLVNQPPEEGRGRGGIRSPIVGHVAFSGVRFFYRGSVVPALDSVSFEVPAGTIFGIMGRSGSGKTTVTRMLQMLHSEYEGLIKVDGNDLRQIDLDHLRSNIGVVLQENFLFSGTISQNIAAPKPDATFEEIARAARLAGAEEFIERLPGGYNAPIAEGSANLSGGQRQRLAIARALIGDPRILILDEATSALDAESEAIVNANLLSIAHGRTLIIISHRLSSLVMADAIMVMERGKRYDVGRHEELLERCDIYTALWNQQHRHLTPLRLSHGPEPVVAGNPT